MAVSPTPTPKPVPSAKWMKVLGAVFASILLIAFLGLGILAAVFPDRVQFDCDAFSFLAVAFAIGGAASASFLGGGAAIEGDLGQAAQAKPLKFSLYGGVAVLVIIFFVFFALKPTDCSGSDRQEPVKILFEGIPEGFRGAASNEFWMQHQRMNVNNQSVMSLRIDDTRVDNGKIWITQDGDEVCELALSVIRDMEQEIDVFHYHDLNPATPFKIEVAVDVNRHADGLPQDCFSRSNIVIPDNLEVSVFASKLRFRKPILDDQPSAAPFFEEGNLELPFEERNQFAGSNWLSLFVSVAHAQGLDLNYDGLAVRLGSENPDLRIDSRRFLGSNFETYATDALSDLSNPANDTNADLLTSLLHGINSGIRSADPTLAPAAGRDLSRSTLPFMADSDLARVIELTGHQDASVRKQARRFIQSFPIDAFEPQIDQILVDSSLGCATDAESWKTYASVYFYYNRLIQEGLNEPLNSARADAWDSRTEQVQDVVRNCMTDTSYAVDAALLDYGRATTYNWSSEIDDTAAIQAANDFLEFVGDQQSDYYMSQHVFTMIGVSAGQ